MQLPVEATVVIVLVGAAFLRAMLLSSRAPKVQTYTGALGTAKVPDVAAKAYERLAAAAQRRDAKAFAAAAKTIRAQEARLAARIRSTRA